MKNLDTIYFAARELAPEDRPTYLTQACAGDDELRKRVTQMLAVSAEAEAFITDLQDDDSEERTSDNGSAKILKRDPAVAPDEAVGQTLGRYKLLERVGEGGCGVVYVAEQTQPVRRRVALKVIKLGMDTKQVVARFEAERQALAMMDHPNIAKVLDAGTTGEADPRSADFPVGDKSAAVSGGCAGWKTGVTGRPYFVMELVRGIKITDYCDQAHLTTQERLDLFIKVCQAIQHAHQKGIIHRDIKPSNILVTLHDGVPVPKVIDFGIAKATEGRLTDATVYTQLHQFIGTPAYMSPEQAEMSGLDIDTRSDIYSLGVLLYELLAGSTPFDAKELMASGIDAMRKTIREKEPMRPSTRLTQRYGVPPLGGKASARSTAPNEVYAQPPEGGTPNRGGRSPHAIKELVHQLQGDLDWIVMKCLEKDRTRRYETANGLAADLNRHLTNEPVLARRPTTAYQLQKAFRRHRLAFTAAAIVTVALLIGIVVSTWQAVRATRAERAQVKLRETAVTATTLAQQEAKRADEQAEGNRLNLYAADMAATQIALKSLNYGKARQLLEWHQPRNGEKDLRGFEWRLLWQQSRGDQLETLRSHSNTVLCVAFAPDGKYLLSGSADQTVVVWDADTGRKVNSWKAHNGSVYSISFSPDGKIVATGVGNGVIKLWQWPGARLMETLTNSGGYAEFHPSEMLLFTGSGPIFRSGYSLAAGALFKFGALNRTERETEFRTPQGSFSVPARVNGLVAVGVEGQPVQLMDQHGALLRNLDDSRNAIALAFSPKADLLASTYFNYYFNSRDRPENEIRIHDPATGKLLVTLTNHTGRAWSVKFSPDGKWLASASSDQTIRLWDTTTWQQANVFKGHASVVRDVVFSPDGKHLASGGEDETVCIWNVTPERTSEEIKGAWVDYGGPNLAEFMGGGELFAARSGNHISVWNVTTGHLEHEFAFGTLLLGEDDSGESILTLNTRTGIAVLQFWDRHDFRLKQELRVQSDIGGLKNASLSFNRKSLLLSLPGEVLQVDCANGSILRHILLPGMTGFMVRLSSDETAWAAFVPGSNFGPGPELAGVGPTERSHAPTALEGHRSGIYSLAFSPTQGLLATASGDGTARLWDAPSGRQVAVLNGHKEGVYDCAFSPDGRTLATASGDRTVKLWHVQTHREMLTLAHNLPVTSVAFSREGNYLATGMVDGTYHFWRAASWEEIKTTGAPVRSDYERATLREGKISTVPDTNDDATQATKWQRRLDDYNLSKKQAARTRSDHPLALKDWRREGSRPNYYTMGLEDSTTLDGQTVAFIKSKEPKIDGFGTYMQSFQSKDFVGKGIRLSAMIKTESAEDGAALWLRVDGPNSEEFVLDNMWGRPIKGTRDWAQYEIVLYVSNRAEAIVAGLLLQGTGQAWISDVKFTVVPEAQLDTELLKVPGAPPF